MHALKCATHLALLLVSFQLACYTAERKGTSTPCVSSGLCKHILSLAPLWLRSVQSFFPCLLQASTVSKNKKKKKKKKEDVTQSTAPAATQQPNLHKLQGVTDKQAATDDVQEFESEFLIYDDPLPVMGTKVIHSEFVRPCASNTLLKNS